MSPGCGILGWVFFGRIFLATSPPSLFFTWNKFFQVWKCPKWEDKKKFYLSVASRLLGTPLRGFSVIYAEPENKTWAGSGFKPNLKFRATGMKRNGNFRFKIFLSKSGFTPEDQKYSWLLVGAIEWSKWSFPCRLFQVSFFLLNFSILDDIFRLNSDLLQRSNFTNCN